MRLAPDGELDTGEQRGAGQLPGEAAVVDGCRQVAVGVLDRVAGQGPP